MRGLQGRLVRGLQGRDSHGKISNRRHTCTIYIYKLYIAVPLNQNHLFNLLFYFIYF